MYLVVRDWSLITGRREQTEGRDKSSLPLKNKGGGRKF